MKIRTGFVSNSSSSSYVCDVCGNAETVWDGALSDAGFCKCEKGHVICEEHVGKNNILSAEDIVELARNRTLGDDWYQDEILAYLGDRDVGGALNIAEEYIMERGLPSAACPVCMLKKPGKEVLLAYALYKLEATDEGLAKSMRDEFGTLENFRKVTKR